MTSWADVGSFRGPVLRGVGWMVDFIQEVLLRLLFAALRFAPLLKVWKHNASESYSRTAVHYHGLG